MFYSIKECLNCTKLILLLSGLFSSSPLIITKKIKQNGFDYSDDND